MNNPGRIDACLTWAYQTLAGGDSPKLDARVLLCHVLKVEPSYLLTWPERCLSQDDWLAFEQLVFDRAAGKPVAHLLGEREFWSLPFYVSEATLIPRPDTEVLVEAALERAQNVRQILDLGTGTGAIAIALAHELPDTQVTAVDVMADAVDLAKRNVQRLAARNVTVLHGSWFEPLAGQQFDMIVSNPPYIEANDPHLSQGDVRFEPISALVSDAQGLADIRHIIESAPNFLTPGGWLLLEHGYNQGCLVRDLLQSGGFAEIMTQQDYAGQPRVSLGRWHAQPA